MDVGKPVLTRRFAAAVAGVVALMILLLAAPSASPGESLEDRLDAARVKIRAGKIPDAIELLNALVLEAPGQAEVYLVLAEAHGKAGDQDSALKDLVLGRDMLSAFLKTRALTAQEERCLKEIKAQEAQLMEFRAREDEILARFRTSGLIAAETLLKNGSPTQAGYVLQELDHAFPDDATIRGMLQKPPQGAP